MKKLFKLFAVLAILGILQFQSSCSKPDDTPAAPTTGNATLWVRSDLGYGNIYVTINGQTQTISSYYSSGSPGCGAASCANFNLAPGNYSFSAVSNSGTATWNGTITVSAGGCFQEELTSSGGGGSGSGNAMFWIASDLGYGNITVTCNGISQLISGYYASSPACGANGSANFSLPAGTYSYHASASGVVWDGSVTVTSGGCFKQQLTGSGGGGSGTGNGNAMLWIASDLGYGNITVTCNGISQIISSYYASSPACGASGSANFSLPSGTYSYHASASGIVWNGSVTVTSGGCFKQQLTGSSGGGGGSSTGNLTVWSQVNHGCGTINVTVAGQTGSITSYYYNGTPSCGSSGCANFTLAPGNYSVSASCSSLTWNGTATVTAGGCFKLVLN